MIYGLHDLEGIHSSSKVRWLLEFWWFRGFLMGLMILEKTVILVWFLVYNCFGCFWNMDGWFIDFIILGDSPTLLRCIDFYSFVGLGVS